MLLSPLTSCRSALRGSLIACSVIAAVSLPSFGQIVIPTVTVGNPGNGPDPSTGALYGSVAYTYNISTFEVTNAEYAEFLNAVAWEDTHSLYNSNMAGAFGGINRFGPIGAFVYTTISGRENYPVTYVSFWDAARYANWLHNGQPTGAQDHSTTESGAYTLNGVTNPLDAPTRNTGWRWAVTSEDEWYKAAYHQPASQGGDVDDYWLFPISSNTITTAQANYGAVVNDITPVGSYAPNFYGTFDMGGNLWEWNEAIIGPPIGSSRGLRGGAFTQFGDLTLRASSRYSFEPQNEVGSVGFRVTQAYVPCAADYNGTPDAGDILDFLDFITDFADCDGQSVPCGQFGNPDINGDTVVDILDLLEFLDAFSEGC